MTWRRVAVQWITVLLLLGILVAIQIYRPEWTGIEMGHSSSGANNYHAIDGDSFRAGKVEIRLYGIDAPEYRQTCSGAGKPQPCGRLALEALSALIRNRDIACTIINHDRYGRQVSVCRDGTLEINREMVQLGWAVAYRKHAMDYVSAEREAKLAKRGIWAWTFEIPEDFRARNKAVQGRVLGVED